MCATTPSRRGRALLVHDGHHSLCRAHAHTHAYTHAQRKYRLQRPISGNEHPYQTSDHVPLPQRLPKHGRTNSNSHQGGNPSPPHVPFHDHHTVPHRRPVYTAAAVAAFTVITNGDTSVTVVNATAANRSAEHISNQGT